MLKTHTTIITKIGTTLDVRSTMCVLSTNERKTQVGWVVVIRWIMQKWAKTNNAPPNGFFYCVPNFDEMIMRSSCLEACKTYSGDGCA
jgi:hypothetical protein